ncbi:MAG: hypothetical protein CM15mV131_510 [uncultured marine virus]|nr:MAG: hypothetical protein CM15mV131_510 [uncultured marine virus]
MCQLYLEIKIPKNLWNHKVFNADKTDLRFKDPKT